MPTRPAAVPVLIFILCAGIALSLVLRPLRTALPSAPAAVAGAAAALDQDPVPAASAALGIAALRAPAVHRSPRGVPRCVAATPRLRIGVAKISLPPPASSFAQTTAAPATRERDWE